MIIKTYQLDKLKENQSNFYLLYGENEGYKNQLIKDILSVGFKDNIKPGFFGWVIAPLLCLSSLLIIVLLFSYR